MSDLDTSVNTFAIPYSAVQSLNRRYHCFLHVVHCMENKYSHTLWMCKEVTGVYCSAVAEHVVQVLQCISQLNDMLHIFIQI